VVFSACGESASSDSEPTGTFQVKVTEARFPTAQKLGQTALLKLTVRNTGKRTVPALTVSFTVAGKEGVDSSLPFGVRDPQPALAQPDRPVWVLAQTYPRLHGSSKPGGASTSSRKSFSLGELKPGASTDAVWKLSAVRSGKYTLLYSIDAGVGGKAKAKTDNGVRPGGSFATEISERLPETEVTNSGEIVEVNEQRSKGSSKR